MRLSARLGQLFAVAWLIILWPTWGALAHGQLPGWRVALTGAVLLLLAGLYVWYWFWGLGRGPRVTLAAAVGLTVLGLGLNLTSDAGSVNSFLLAIAVAGYGLPVRLAIPAIAGVILLSTVSTGLQIGPLPGGEVVVAEAIAGLQLVLYGTAAIGVGALVRTIAELHVARETIARLAVEEERARFARDLHDLIGHSLSLITLKGELVGQLIPSAPERAQNEIRELVHVAREALREVREAVSGYRQPTLATELAGARAALLAAGIGCHVDQQAGALTREAEAVIGWTIREGVTNVIRHSHARRCDLILLRDAGSIRVDVVDDGAPGPASPQAGNGLRGLGERVAHMGGRLEAERLPHGGFRLRVSIPIEPVLADASRHESGEPQRRA
ncbi:MAG TPA: sensor histidine kinase [Candidatus Limnocylindrales bacterium]|nr:sensor histidine kinase [Candidatus Limnocylindrales bacterium]